MCRRTLACVRENQQLHEVVVHREAGRLNDEDILPADALLDHHLDLAVVEMPDESLTKRDADTVCDIFRKLRIRIPCQDAHIVGRKTHLSVPPKNQMRHKR